LRRFFVEAKNLRNSPKDSESKRAVKSAKISVNFFFFLKLKICETQRLICANLREPFFLFLTDLRELFNYFLADLRRKISRRFTQIKNADLRRFFVEAKSLRNSPKDSESKRAVKSAKISVNFFFFLKLKICETQRLNLRNLREPFFISRRFTQIKNAEFRRILSENILHLRLL
jgi:hypothetical protein